MNANCGSPKGKLGTKALTKTHPAGACIHVQRLRNPFERWPKVIRYIMIDNSEQSFQWECVYHSQIVILIDIVDIWSWAKKCLLQRSRHSNKFLHPASCAFECPAPFCRSCEASLTSLARHRHGWHLWNGCQDWTTVFNKATLDSNCLSPWH